MKTKVTLSVDKNIYNSFKKFCNENAIILSKRLENEMVRIMKEDKKNKKNGKKICFFLIVFLFLFSFISAQEINAAIEGGINNLFSVFFIFISDECTSGNSDNFDLEIPPNLEEQVSFYSVVNDKNLSVDCWNPKEGPRNLTLVYKIYEPANYTGNILLVWNPSDFFVSSNPQKKLNSFLVDLTTNQRINLSLQSSASFSNSQRERIFRLETYYEWCGDGVRNLNEACDGNDLGGQTCVSLGYYGGNLGCNPVTCQFNRTGCHSQSGEHPKDDGSIGGGGGGGESSRGCTDECKLGERKCVSNKSFMVCGNFDNDSCAEWGIEEKCVNIAPFCKNGFCYECLTDRDCKEGFCVNGKCEMNCNKSCEELGFECGKYFFCGKLLECGNCSVGFCNKGLCSSIPENALKMDNRICDPDYICSPWSECKISFDFESVLLGKEWFRGKKERICFDKNKCYSTIKEKEDCIAKKEIFTKKVNICGREYIEVYDKKTNNLLARLTDSRYSKKSLVEIFLLPREIIVCEDEKEDYKLSFFDKLLLSLDVRKVWGFIK